MGAIRGSVQPLCAICPSPTLNTLSSIGDGCESVMAVISGVALLVQANLAYHLRHKIEYIRCLYASGCPPCTSPMLCVLLHPKAPLG